MGGGAFVTGGSGSSAADWSSRAERAVSDASRAGFETVVVRPRYVWGKGDTTLLPEMVTAVEAGRWTWVGGGRNLTETTHVDNAVEGLLLAGGPCEAYFVTRDQGLAQLRNGA